MFERELSLLDPDATLSAAREARSIVDRAETRLLELAAHWADLHGHLDRGADESSLPGMERLVRLGGQGTPEVAEFAPAELAAELALSPYSAARLIGDALDLRHRLPRLWSRVLDGQVRPWIACKTASSTRELSAELAAVVDRRISPWAHSLSWGRLEAVIAGVVIDADPEAAAATARQAEGRQGVWIGRSTDAGIKDIYIRTETPNAIWFDASIDRIADGLALLGDGASQDIRRGRAVGVLAQPQRALDLFSQAAAASAATSSASDEAEGEPDDGAGARTGTREVDHGAWADPRPPATLYVHVSQEVLDGDVAGVARLEGIGPVITDQVRRWLGHCRVTVKPVIDLPNQIPVDAYEIPDRLREAVHLRSPVDVFPFATNTTRKRDIDHTEPYRDPDGGGPPGQTRLDNLGPLTRFHHRIRTHGRWQVVQPVNGIFIWRSPHGRTYIVDHTGTRPAFAAA
jgi:hypothetical protein